MALTTAATTAATAYATAAQGTKADNALPAANVSVFGGTLIDDADAATARTTLGLGTAGVVASPLPGPSGNVEYFLWLKPGAPAPQYSDVRQAVKEGPQ